MNSDPLRFAFEKGIPPSDDPGWRDFRQGIKIWRVPGTGDRCAFLVYEAGAAVPLHRHNGTEIIVVLSGAQEDENGRYISGSTLMHKEGTRHSVQSPEGCVVLAYWMEPVEFIK